jgi:hypothetical protein
MPADLIEYIQQPVPQAVIWVTVLMIVSMAAFYVVQKFRDQSGDDHLTPNELLTNFREMNQEGDMDDGEFRTIKTVLAPQLLDPADHSAPDTSTPKAPKPAEQRENDEDVATVSESTGVIPADARTESRSDSDPTTADHESENEGEDTAKNIGGND